MADLEKSPLLPTEQRSGDGTSEANLQELRQQVDSSRTAWIEANKAYAEAWRRTSSGRITTLIHNIILSIVGFISIMLIGTMLFALGYAIIYDEDMGPPRRIPMEAAIMSKCPDARDCLRDMVLPAMMEVSSEVDFKLNYIGTPTDSEDGVLCKHGPSECLGNMLELCAAKHYPNPKIYLGFTMCMTRQYSEIPDESLVKDCALEHGISFDKLNKCASDEDGGRGMQLLRNSVERSQSLNVSTSCTVRLDDKTWCVRDGGEWKDCEGGSSVRDLVREVRRLRDE